MKSASEYESVKLELDQRIEQRKNNVIELLENDSINVQPPMNIFDPDILLNNTTLTHNDIVNQQPDTHQGCFIDVNWLTRYITGDSIDTAVHKNDSTPVTIDDDSDRVNRTTPNVDLSDDTQIISATIDVDSDTKEDDNASTNDNNPMDDARDITELNSDDDVALAKDIESQFRSQDDKDQLLQAQSIRTTHLKWLYPGDLMDIMSKYQCRHGKFTDIKQLSNLRLISMNAYDKLIHDCINSKSHISDLTASEQSILDSTIPPDRLTTTDLCNECSKPKLINEIKSDNRHRHTSDILDQLQKFKQSQSELKQLKQSSLSGVYISKQWLQNYKRAHPPTRAKPGTMADINQQSAEFYINSNIMLSDILCEHNKLSLDSSSRDIVPIPVYTMLAESYLDFPLQFNVSDSTNCQLCTEQAESESIQQKQVIKEYKVEIQHLTKIVKKPDDFPLSSKPPVINKSHKSETFYIVPVAFIQQLRQFTEDIQTAVVDKPSPVDTSILYCTQHQLLQYAPWPIDTNASASGLYDSRIGTTPGTHISCLLKSEYELLKKYNYINETSKIPTFTISIVKLGNENNNDNQSWNNLSITTAPDVCHVCIKARVECERLNKLQYTVSQCRISYIMLSDKNEVPSNNVSKITSSNDATTAQRRKRTVRQSSQFNDAYNVHVSCTETLIQLKLKIMESQQKYSPNEQHIYYNKIELSDPDKTLYDYQIPCDALLYIKIDAMDDESRLNQMLDKDYSAEQGFANTALASTRINNTSPTTFPTGTSINNKHDNHADVNSNDDVQHIRSDIKPIDIDDTIVQQSSQPVQSNPSTVPHPTNNTNPLPSSPNASLISNSPPTFNKISRVTKELHPVDGIQSQPIKQHTSTDHWKYELLNNNDDAAIAQQFQEEIDQVVIQDSNDDQQSDTSVTVDSSSSDDSGGGSEYDTTAKKRSSRPKRSVAVYKKRKT